MGSVPTSANRIQLLDLITLSTYHYIKDKISDDNLSATVQVLAEYPATGVLISPPSIVIGTENDYEDRGFQLGGGELVDNLVLRIEVYGQDRTQRNGLAWQIKQYLNNSFVPLKDYNEGFPEHGASPSTLANMEVMAIRLPPVPTQVVGEDPKYLRHWRPVLFTVDFIVPSGYR